MKIIFLKALVNYLYKVEENDFVSRQKNEFLEALKYTEDHILSRSAEEWTSATVLKDITSLNQILGKTLRVHPLSHTSEKISKEGYRLESVVSYRPCPLPEYSARFNIQNPGNIFKCLSASDKAATAAESTNDIFASATDFLKWYLKWDKQYDFSFQELEDTVKRVVEDHGGNVEQWRNTHFDGKSLSSWHHDFFENEGKSFKFPDDLSGLIKTALTRHTVNGLYTPQELKAIDRVIKFFLPPQEIPQAMQKMAEKVVKMIQEKAEPIDIASYVRYAITHEIHPFPNGNGRTASVYINSILMRFGYPPIPRQTRALREKDVLEVRNSPNRYVLYREKLRNRLRNRCQHDFAPACETFRTKKEMSPNNRANPAQTPKNNKEAISGELASPTKASKKRKARKNNNHP